jgi:hypothetical protein
VVKKKDGSFCLVQDFRALNQQTYIDKYSMRDVSDCIQEIGKSESTIFSTIDLTSGFWQMVLEPNSRPLAAFTAYGMGQYEFNTSAMEHFSHHLRGKRFLLFTDHKPLEKLGKVHTKTLYRIQEAMLQYDFEIHYRKGEEMPADYLSRNILSINDDLDNKGLQQEKDEQLSTIIRFLKTGKLPNNKEGKYLNCKICYSLFSRR